MIKPPSGHPAHRAPAAFSYEEDITGRPTTETKRGQRKTG